MGQDVDIVDGGMRFNDFWAVRHVDVSIKKGEFFSFLGPSGCGKTTLLRLISGFLEPTEGMVKIGGKDMKGIGPNKRNTSLIFQNLALFPLMSVAENIGFGLEVRGVSKKERRIAAEELLELVNLSGSADKRVDELSGGQKQRVAIARALAVKPSVLMLDEPLSALDLKLRQHMRTELRKIQRQTGVTFIYITHDQTEALTMSDRIAVMSEGKIEQLDSPGNIYNNPKTSFVASFVGETNRLDGIVRSTNGSYALFETTAGTLKCRNPYKLQAGERTAAFIRPETIVLDGDNGPKCKSSNGAANNLEARIEKLDFEGAFINLMVKTFTNSNLLVRLNNSGNREKELQPEMKVELRFDHENVLLLPEKGMGNA